MRLASRLTILGHPWVIHYWPAKDFRARFGTDSTGMAECDAREIYLLASRLTEELVRHELHHAYVSELCLDVANLSGDQMEEACAELLSKYGERIINQAAQSVARYRKLKARVRS